MKVTAQGFTFKGNDFEIVAEKVTEKSGYFSTYHFEDIYITFNDLLIDADDLTTRNYSKIMEFLKDA